jgi:hypothetical protein
MFPQFADIYFNCKKENRICIRDTYPHVGEKGSDALARAASPHWGAQRPRTRAAGAQTHNKLGNGLNGH